VSKRENADTSEFILSVPLYSRRIERWFYTMWPWQLNNRLCLSAKIHYQTLTDC